MEEYGTGEREHGAEGIYQKEQITDMGSSTMRTPNGTIHCLTIIGHIVISDSDLNFPMYLKIESIIFRRSSANQYLLDKSINNLTRYFSEILIFYNHLVCLRF